MSRCPPASSGGGVTPPTPPDLPQSGSLVARWSASSLALADGATVTSWVDSINGLTAVTNTGTPTYQTNQFNSKPSVRFGGAACLVSTITGSALKTAFQSGEFTILINFRVRGATTLGGLLSDNAGGNAIYAAADGTNAGLYNNGLAFAYPTAGAGFNTMILTSTKTVVTGPGNECQYLNGSCYHTNTNFIPYSGDNNLVFGAGFVGGTLPVNADIMDIYIWSLKLNFTESLQATNYFFDSTQYNQTKPWTLKTYYTIFDGNSQVASVGAADTAHTLAYVSAAALGLSLGQWSVVAFGGLTWANMITKFPTWSGIGAFLGKNMKVYADEYANANAAGQSSAQILSDTAAYYVLIQATPNTKLATGTNISTTQDSPLGDAKRVAVVAGMILTPALYGDGLVRLDLNTSIGLNGADGVNSFSVNGGGAGLNLYADTLHPNNAGYAVKEPLVTTGLNALAG